MNFNLAASLEILERTPYVLKELLHHLSHDWTDQPEGENTWSPYEVIVHLIHGEKTDWMPRAEIILSDKADKKFELFNRFAQFEECKGKSLTELLDQFKLLRSKNIALLRSKNITENDLQQTGIHPAFGKVSLSQLLSTWVVHDLNHIAQIARVIAHQYKAAVGPWVEYLGILQQKK